MPPEGRNCAFVCFEADRSTMPRERFLAKLHAYHAWQAAGGHTAALGIKSFRVLRRANERPPLTAAAEDGHLASRRVLVRLRQCRGGGAGRPRADLAHRCGTRRAGQPSPGWDLTPCTWALLLRKALRRLAITVRCAVRHSATEKYRWRKKVTPSIMRPTQTHRLKTRDRGGAR